MFKLTYLYWIKEMSVLEGGKRYFKVTVELLMKVFICTFWASEPI